MKSFLIFAGDINKTPKGGWGDFYGDADTLKEAQKQVRGKKKWFQILDVQSLTIIDSYNVFPWI